jgi:DNA gyrase/topoisomerase IV subunit B
MLSEGALKQDEIWRSISNSRVGSAYEELAGFLGDSWRGGYIPDIADLKLAAANGPIAIVLNVLDYSFGDQAYGGGSAAAARITLFDNGSVAIVDDGVGLKLHDDEYPLDTMLEAFITPTSGIGKSPLQALYIVNAASVRLTVTNYRLGQEWQEEFSEGIPIREPQLVGISSKTGVELHFYPSPRIFNDKLSMRVLADAIATVLSPRYADKHITVSDGSGRLVAEF